MGGRETLRGRLAVEGARVRFAVGGELRAARLASGLSLAGVGLAAQMSREKVRRIERGLAESVSLRDLVAVASVVGLDVSLKLYPGGRPVRDIGQVRLLQRFRDRLHPSLAWQTEVPVPLAGDRRAWDAVVRGEGFRVGIEGEVRVGDVQAVQRRAALKARDSGIDRVVLLVADTRHNRTVLRAAGDALAGFPLSTRQVLAALSAGRDPGGSGIVVL